MIIETSVAIIAFSLVVWMIILFILLLNTRKALESVKRDIHSVSTNAVELMHKVDDLADDIKSKSDSLDVVLRPLKSIGKPKHRNETSETVSEVVEWVSTSLILFNKIKNAVKHREK